MISTDSLSLVALRAIEIIIEYTTLKSTAHLTNRFLHYCLNGAGGFRKRIFEELVEIQYMIPLYSKKDFDNAKTLDLLPLKCKQCHCTFYRSRNRIVSSILKPHRSETGDYCSTKCQKLFQTPPVFVTCAQCHKKNIRRNPCKMKKTKSGNYFCSHSCAATYNNTHKTKGTRKSKLECWLEKQLPKKYKQLDFLFNDKTAINSELDIFIPSLKLAFELNGIFHYEPIFGQKKLSQIQNNDKNKFHLCIAHKINLCIVDVSGLKYFKEQKAIKYLDIITSIIDKELNIP